MTVLTAPYDQEPLTPPYSVQHFLHEISDLKTLLKEAQDAILDSDQRAAEAQLRSHALAMGLGGDTGKAAPEEDGRWSKRRCMPLFVVNAACPGA